MTDLDQKPRLRFKGFTEAWEQRELGQTVQITMGTSPEGSTYSDVPSDHILIQGNADLVDGWVVPRVWTTQVTKKADVGDLIMSVRAPAGAMGKTAYNAVIGRGVAAIKGNEFIYQILIKMDANGYWKKLSAGSTFESLNSEAIKKAEIKVPNTREQEQIGNLLFNVDSLITLHQRKYEKLKSMKTALLEKMFPAGNDTSPKIRFKGFTEAWEQRKVKEIAERYDNLRIPVAASQRERGSIPYYGANGIQDYVNGFTHNGEFVLVAEDGANDLKNYPVQYVNGKIWVNNHAHVLQSNKNNNTMFLKYLIGSTDIESLLVGGGRAKLNAEVLMSIDLTLPNKVEQKQIAIFFDRLDSLITLHQRKCEKLKNLKKSLLERMFI